MENKSSFCSTTINRKEILMIEVISRDREKNLIYIMFKESDNKSAWIEFIQNIDDETKKWRGIKMTKKR